MTYFLKPSPTISDYDECDWEDAVYSAYAMECSAYFESFRDKITEASERGDEQHQNVFTVMWAATSLHLNDPTNETKPFCPKATGIGIRFAEVDDFTDEHLEVFGQLIPRIKDHELRARIADIVWVRKRGYQVAEQAVSAYLDSARRLEDTEKPWPPCLKRIRRAITLSVLHGRNAQMFRQVINHIEDTLDRHKENDPSYLSAELMEILLDQKEGDSAKYAQLAEKHANSAEADEDWYRPKTYWELQARWLERAKDNEGSRAARIREAEQYENAAKNLVNRPRPDYLTAAEIQKSAVQVLQRVGGEQERIQRLHREFLEYQRKGLGQMGIVSAEVSIDEPYRDAINSVKGKPLSEAIRALAMISLPPKLDSMRQDLEQNMREFPLMFLIPWIQQDSAGRTTGFVPSSQSNNARDREASVHSHLLLYASRWRSLMVQARIEPARQEILEEHSVGEQDFAPFVADNPFVPEGRETLYVRGLHAGLEGEFEVAVHLLVPEMENSIRHVLSKRGVITSGLDSKGIQKVYGLGKLLHRPEMKAIFGDDITFDLQGLLVKSETGVGDNLRNDVAHGLMNEEDFYRAHAVYLWWLTLHLLYCFAQLSQSITEQP